MVDQVRAGGQATKNKMVVRNRRTRRENYFWCKRVSHEKASEALAKLTVWPNICYILYARVDILGPSNYQVEVREYSTSRAERLAYGRIVASGGRACQCTREHTYLLTVLAWLTASLFLVDCVVHRTSM